MIDTRTEKRFTRGTHRTVAPEDTVARINPWLSDFGITRVADVTGMDCIGIDTVMVVRPNSRSVSVSQGKGTSLSAAKASGLMESIEQYHAEHIIAPLLLASARDLGPRENVVDIARLPQFDRKCSADDRIPWISGRELGSGEVVWLPYEMVHLDLTLPLPAGSGYFLSGSNGLASGNELLEATNHALCELIERDALTLFFEAGAEEQQKRRLDPETIDDDVCGELLEKYRRAAVDVAVWDATSDVGIACFLCWILDARQDAFRPVGLAQGAGCHPDRSVALARALCEAAQSRLTRVVGSRDDIQARELNDLRSPLSTALHHAQMSAELGLPRRFHEVESKRCLTFEEDLDHLRERLRRAGVPSIAVVDLSKDEYPFRVVRVVAPGLEAPAYLPGYHPGERALRLRTQARFG